MRMCALQVRNMPCDCDYPEACDSQRGTLPPTRKAAAAAAASATAVDSTLRADDSAESKQQATCSPRPSRAQSGADHPSDIAANARNAEHPVDGAQQSGPEADTASEARLQALEDLSVNGVYNAIAPHFSATRCSLEPTSPKRRMAIMDLRSCELCTAGCRVRTSTGNSHHYVSSQLYSALIRVSAYS